MSAYKHALHLSSTERGPRLQLAAELLAEGSEVVVLDDALALRPESDKILCEVISAGERRTSSSSRERQTTLEGFDSW